MLLRLYNKGAFYLQLSGTRECLRYLEKNES
jgi:hypothetical protein